MGRDDRYDINLDVKYGYSRRIDVGAEAAAHEPWFNQTLTTVNDSVVRPVVHRTRAPKRTVVMIGRVGGGRANRRLTWYGETFLIGG